MNIIAKSKEHEREFYRRLIVPFRIIGVNIEPYLEEYSIYVGINPNPDFPRPHVDRGLMRFVLPCYYANLFGWEERYIATDYRWGIHEIFHDVHLDRLKTRADWDTWGIKTDNKVELSYINESVQTPSYERFANEGTGLYDYSLDKQYYFDILGGKRTTDYQLMHYLTLLRNLNLISDSIYYRRNNVIDKYM